MMRRSKYIILFVLAALVMTGCTVNGPFYGNIVGEVRSSRTDAPIPGALVEIAGRKKPTDENGKFEINNITAKALDNRVGCYVMIKALMEMGTPYNDVYLVFTVQEELGCRGAKVAAERLKPDIGIAVDITPAHDYPCDLEGNNTLGEGAGIKISDPSVICDEYLVNEMVKCCEENDIKYQYDVIAKGGTDASSINLSNYGVRASGITIATRYPHGPNSMVNMDDVEASIKLLSKYVSRKFEFE